jgi:hypothetical protein
MANSAQNPIDNAEMEIRRDREDLKRLKRRYPGHDFLPVSKNGAVSVVESKPAPVAAAVPAPPPLAALEQAVLAAINSQPNEEWTSRGVVMALRNNGSYRLADNADAALNAVGIALASLTEKERIIRSHEGRGRDPHRYLSVQAAETEAPEIDTGHLER